MRLRFPLGGIHKGAATMSQPDGTTFSCNNMRAYDSDEHRARGGQRPALDKWGSGTQIGGADQPVVAIVVMRTLT